MNVQFGLMGIAAMALCGCSTHVALTVSSQPEGAYITDKVTGAAHGVTPVVISYPSKQLEDGKTADGCYLANGLEAHWVSGASAFVDPVRLCGKSNGTYNITFSRSPTLPGLERDLQFALQLQQTRAQQQQANAASEAAAAATQAAAAAMYKAKNPPKKQHENCKPATNGSTTPTNCN